VTYSFHERALLSGLALARSVAGIAVTVTRDSTTINISKAMQGQTSKQPLGDDTEITVDTADWLIAVSDYTIGTPANGDIITRTLSGTTYTYTVETPDYAQQCWDWSDTSKTQYRIHSRKDGATAFDVSKPNGFDLGGIEERYL